MQTPFQSGLEPFEGEAITIKAILMRSHSDSSLPFLKSNTTGKGSSLEATDPFWCRSTRAYVRLFECLKTFNTFKKNSKKVFGEFLGDKKRNLPKPTFHGVLKILNLIFW